MSAVTESTPRDKMSSRDNPYRSERGMSLIEAAGLVPTATPYAAAEDAKLKALFLEGVMEGDLVIAMGRPLGSVQRRKRKLGLRWPKTFSEQDKIRELATAGWRVERIARQFDLIPEVIVMTLERRVPRNSGKRW